MEEFTHSITVTEPGYLLVFLSNESETSKKVFFDELSVTLTQPIIQVDDYYPFGMTVAETGYRNAGGRMNRFLFNGVEQDQTTGNYETLFRGYDAALGRFMQTDPLADIIPGISPYHFGFNNPVSFSDPLGLMGNNFHISKWAELSNEEWMEQSRPHPNDPAYYEQFQFEKSVHAWRDYVSYQRGEAPRYGGAGVKSTTSLQHTGYTLAGFMPNTNTPIISEVWEPVTEYYFEPGDQSSGRVQQAGIDLNVPMAFWSVASYSAGVYENMRAISITNHMVNDLKELQQIRNFNRLYKATRQATLLENIAQNGKLLGGIKLGAKRMVGVGTVIGLIDMAAAPPEERLNKGLWVAADTVMGVVGLTGWGAPIAGVYFAGRFAYGIYEMVTSDD